MSDIKPPDMSGVPERIWLVMGDPPPEPGTDFRELVEVHWCEDQMFDADIEYVRADRQQHPGEWPEEPTPAMIEAMRTGSRKDWPSDELCRVRYAALRSAALASASVAGEAVSWQVRRTDGSPLACWETCTRDLYNETLATGRYNGLEGAPPCEVRALAVINISPQASAPPKENNHEQK